MSAERERREPLTRVCVLLPTYNEIESLGGVVQRLRTVLPEVDVMIIDDNSPDGTGDLAQALAAEDAGIQVLHRPGKGGLGAAYLAGFAQAATDGYDAVVEMDADGSHLPEQLPTLIAAAAQADVVIGSRWVTGGAIHRWPWHRKALSRGGNRYVRALLGIDVADATAGYRVYRLDALEQLDLDTVASHGYCFQVDLTLRALDRGLHLVEVPIDFWEREAGHSKMGGSIVLEAFSRVSGWGVQRRTQALTEWARTRGPERESRRWQHLAD